MRQLNDWLQMALFQEARAKHLTLREVSELLAVSPRKSALLSKRLKSNFLDVEAEVSLPRRIEYLLWAEPLSVARMAQALPAIDGDLVEEAVARLLEEGRVRKCPGTTVRYEVVRAEFRLVDSKGWLSQIDGINALLETVGRTVFTRFFGDAEAQAGAFARNVGLRVRRQDRAKLHHFYETVMWPFLASLDEAAQGAHDAEDVALSVLWSTDKGEAG